jgi:hypothetical protein
MNWAISGANGGLAKLDRIAAERHVIVVDMTLAVGRPVRLARTPLATAKTKAGETGLLHMEVFITIKYMLLWISSNTKRSVSGIN